METKEAKPEVVIKRSQDTDTDDSRITGGKVIYEDSTGSYDFILDSDFITGIGLFPIKINHN